MILKNIFIARCSAIGKIMSEPKQKHPKLILNDHLDSIESKKTLLEKSKDKEGKTALKLIDSIKELESKTDLLKLNASKIHLSATCLDYVYRWLKEQPEFYGSPTSFSSKYTTKGNLCEQDSITLAAQYYGWGNVGKNTIRLSNSYLTGEPDVILDESVEDIKNSWSQDTFPLFHKEIPVDGYGWQGQGYMELCNKQQFGLVYTLMDAPEKMIEKEARRVMYELGLDDLDAELYDEVYEKMTYSKFSLELRIKRFSLYRDKNCMGNVERRVNDIRKFIEQL